MNDRLISVGFSGVTKHSWVLSVLLGRLACIILQVLMILVFGQLTQYWDRQIEELMSHNQKPIVSRAYCKPIIVGQCGYCFFLPLSLFGTSFLSLLVLREKGVATLLIYLKHNPNCVGSRCCPIIHYYIIPNTIRCSFTTKSKKDVQFVVNSWHNHFLVVYPLVRGRTDEHFFDLFSFLQEPTIQIVLIA